MLQITDPAAIPQGRRPGARGSPFEESTRGVHLKKALEELL